MSGLLGKTQTINRNPTDVSGLRSDTASYLQSRGPGGINSANYLNDPSFVNQIITPIRNLFNQNLSRSLAQAKESAGNLTGSGLATSLGGEVNRSLATESSLESGLLDQNAQGNASRFLQLLMSMNTAGVGAPEVGYKPGALESILGLIGQVGGLVAGKGGAAAAGGAAASSGGVSALDGLLI